MKQADPRSLRSAQIEIEAAKVLRDQIATLAAGDEDFIRDTMEGETGLREMIGALAADDASDAAIIAAIKELAKKLDARTARIAKRVEMRRALIGSAMQIAELKKLETPAGTITLKSVPPRLVVIEEADIPAEYFKQPPPALDRAKLTEALKVNDSIPGASLSNGSTTIQIRS